MDEMDILKLAMQGGAGNGPPNMGVNHLSLGNAMAPMMGPNPKQASPVGALGFGLERGAQMAQLNKASGLAQLDAMMKAQQAGEWQAGGPGRMQSQKLREMLLDDEVKNFEKTREQKRQLDSVKSKSELAKKELERLAPYAEAWDKMESYPERNMLFENLKAQDEGFGAMKFKNLKFEQADMLMRAVKHAKGQTKGEIENAKVEQKERDSIRDNETLLSREDIRGRNSQAIARIRAMSQPDRRRMIEQLTDLVSQGKTLTPAQQAAYVFAVQMEGLKHTAAADRAPPRTSLKGGEVVTESVPRPEIPTPPGVNPGTPPSGSGQKKKGTFEDAVAMAKADPKLRASFEKRYGKALADQHLGKR